MGGEIGDEKKKILKRHITISFSKKDLEGIKVPHQDLIVISIIIKKTKLLRVLVNTGATIDIIYWDSFKNIHLKEDELKPNYAPIKEFGQTKVPVVGRITIPVT